MGTKQSAIENGFQLPDGTLEPTDVLIDINFKRKSPSWPVRGGEHANTDIAQRLRALRELRGLSLEETIRAMKARKMHWSMREYSCHIARGRCIVARNGKLLDNKGNVTRADASSRRV
jgi:hypothetical protein